MTNKELFAKTYAETFKGGRRSDPSPQAGIWIHSAGPRRTQPAFCRGDEMTDTKHTPGTWIQYGYDITTTEGLFPIAKLNPVLDISEIEANARLIAAAPELLEALEFALKALYAPDCPAIPDGAMVKGKIYNAIAKAKGE